MYSYIKYRWDSGLDMDEIEKMLSEGFSVSRRDYPGDSIEVSLFKDDRVELMVSADRLRAHVNAHRAILNQVVEGVFTAHDMELRAFIIEHYPRNRPTPFPWSYSFEPEFETEG